MNKADKSSASRFFYSFGTVFLFAVLTICIINFTRDGRIFEKATPVVKTETTSSSPSKTEGTIKIDTSVPKTPAKPSGKKQAKPSGQAKAPTGAAKPANPGEEP